MKNNASLIYNVCLVIGDGVAIIGAFTLAYILRVTINHHPVSSPIHAVHYITILISLLPFWLLIFALLGLYNARVYDRRFSELGRLIVGSAISILSVISFSYLDNITVFPARLVTVYAFVLGFSFVFIFRTLARGIRRELFDYGIGINYVLIVGDTLTSHRLISALKNTAVTGHKVIGLVGGAKHHLKEKYDDIQVFASFSEAVKTLKGHDLNKIIQTELYSEASTNDELLTYAQEHHIAYGFVPGNTELFVGNIEADLFYSVPLIAVHQTALIGWGRVIKRTIDLVLGSLMLIVASPFMLLIALLIKLTDGGPVFFRQQRFTRYNRKFKLFKFRSNYLKYNGLTPEEAFSLMNRTDLIKPYRKNGDYLEDDPRLTPIGKYMRRYSLDELPQLFNVLKGDLSLIGPRPLATYEMEDYEQKSLILSVRSGISGLAQISGIRDLSFNERRALDLYYVQNWSFWGDMVILAKTVWVVLFHKGTRS